MGTLGYKYILYGYMEPLGTCRVQGVSLGALTIKLGIGGILYHNSNKEHPKPYASFM